MNILMIGDIVGKPGRHAVHNSLARVRADYSIDFIVANGENLANGTGIQPESFKNLVDMGVDVVTSGNHIFSKKEVKEILGKDPPALEAAQLPFRESRIRAGYF